MNRVWIEIELREHNQRNQTVDHETIDGYTELSVSTSGLYKGHKRGVDIDFGGQCIDMLREVTKPAKGWTVADLGELADLWEHWHLNGMRAACAHQDRDAGMGSPDCPVSGYRWGHARLVEPLPDDVADKGCRVRCPARWRLARLGGHTAMCLVRMGRPTSRPPNITAPVGPAYWKGRVSE